MTIYNYKAIVSFSIRIEIKVVNCGAISTKSNCECIRKLMIKHKYKKRDEIVITDARTNYRSKGGHMKRKD
jgi:hypothetical protein